MIKFESDKSNPWTTFFIFGLTNCISHCNLKNKSKNILIHFQPWFQHSFNCVKLCKTSGKWYIQRKKSTSIFSITIHIYAILCLYKHSFKFWNFGICRGNGRSQKLGFPKGRLQRVGNTFSAYMLHRAVEKMLDFQKSQWSQRSSIWYWSRPCIRSFSSWPFMYMFDKWTTFFGFDSLHFGLRHARHW